MPKADPPKQARLFAFPTGRPTGRPIDEPDGGVPADAVAMLRVLARQAAEAGADPSALVSPDLELLLVCDSLFTLMRQVDAVYAEWRRSPSSDPHADYDEYKRRRRAMRPALLKAAKLKAQTATGIFAKAAAVRRVGGDAAKMAVSLADDLLASPELRRAVWPAADRE